MPVQMVDEEAGTGHVLVIEMSGKLTRQDYEAWAPELDQQIAQHGTVNMLAVMRDFHGWKPGAAWDDLKLGLRHYSHIRRVALVGDTRWQKWMAWFCRPFTSAEVRYFDLPHLDEARAWVEAA